MRGTFFELCCQHGNANHRCSGQRGACQQLGEVRFRCTDAHDGGMPHGIVLAADVNVGQQVV